MSRTAFLLSLASVSLLAACAPTITDTAGRLVNTVSGQEGRVVFLGGFQTRAAVPGTPDNVTVQLGQDFYSGQYSVIGNDGPVNLRFGLSGGFSSGDGFFRHGYDAGLRAPAIRNVARPGNLIVKTLKLDTAAVKTLICTFQADSSGHGVGDCRGSNGATYALQF
ncbi:hypothetical protein GCM10022631_07000 [Deinococcus rubellus]|uniref:Lipoprotein n=1 Tax=Deinococcus rubellus TaxID=1889240 RepID=A0ABY5YFT4_9DEIO|nr:hypothetical protein [Deinococcus rubellus]UWX63959.1 hypothetical protein N0D28_14755 [Deinococcus rubellus]